MQVEKPSKQQTQKTSGVRNKNMTSNPADRSGGLLPVALPTTFQPKDWAQMWRITYELFTRIVYGGQNIKAGNNKTDAASGPPADKVFQKGAVVAVHSGLHLRTAPEHGKVLMTIPYMTSIEVIQQNVPGHAGWAKVSLRSGEQGYVFAQYLKFLKHEASKAAVKQPAKAKTKTATNMKDPAQLALSDNGADFIARHEGFKNHVYNDPSNYATVGYGHLLHKSPVTAADTKKWGTMTKAQGKALLKKDAARTEAGVRRLVKVPLTQSMFDALVSFAYNAGVGNLKRSTLLKKLNKKDYTGAANEFHKWVKSGGKKLTGLVTRRAEEKEMFCQDGC